MRNRYTEKEIYDRAEKLTLYSPYTNNLRMIAAYALAYAPNEVVDYIIENCCIHSLEPNMGGMYIARNLLGDRDIIFVWSKVYSGYMDDHVGTILHECAHCWLKHKSLLDGITLVQQREQEAQAERLVRKWLRESPRKIMKGGNL